MLSNILVAYDGSEHSKRALEYASYLASKLGSKLFIVTVVDVNSIWYLDVGPLPNEIVTNVKEKYRSVLEEAVNKMKELSINAEGHLLEGEPAEEILKFASTHPIQLIVTGSRGLSRVKKIILGSVSSEIVNNSTIPVLVVK